MPEKGRFFNIIRKNPRWLAGPALALLLLSQPQAAAAGAARAMAEWAAAVAPALFPFLALLPLLTCGDAIRAYEALLGGVARAAFDLPGAAAPALVIGMLAGSPAGAMAARRIAAQSGMTRGQLRRVAVAVAGLSPAFLVSGVGAGMLGSPAMGRTLLLSQVLTQLTLALALRRAWRNDVVPVPAPPPSAQEPPLRPAVLAVLTVCGWMALFGALVGAARAWIGGGWADALLCLIDLPSGARIVAALPLAREGRLALLAALCGFGGACIGAQNLSALKGCGLSPAVYFALRLLAAGCAALYAVLPARLPAFLPEIDSLEPLAVGGLAVALLSVPVVFGMLRRTGAPDSP